MTWNEQNKANSIMDVLEGTVQEWYDQVDGLLKASDFIPGNYEYSINTAYSNANDFQEGGSTHIDIKCDRFKFISLDNSYISLDLEIPINKPTIAAVAGTHTRIKPKAYYIGFKSAFDAISQYRIYSNSDLIQTQNNSNYESFLQYMSLSDVAKENSELYATWNKIQNMNEDVPGTYISSTITDTTAAEIKVPIKLRIPLNQFLMLANLKWFPSFFGTLTLEIFPSYRNLVILPVYDLVDKALAPAATYVTKDELAALADVDNKGTNIFGFRQINTEFVYAIDNRTTAQAANPSATPPVPAIPANTKSLVLATFTASTSTTKQCHIRLAETLIRMDVYNECQTRFVNKPMLFPIQSISSTNFSGQMSSSSGASFSLTQGAALKHCNSMYVVFKKSNDDRTVFENPMITYQINIAGRYFPREQYQTYDDRRNMNLFLDATNFNGNGLFSVPDDIYHSLQPYVKVQAYSAAGAGSETKTYNPKDRSNFAIAIPFCDDDTFQAGLDTKGTVQVELTGSRTAICPTLYRSTDPTALYVEDCILKLRSVKPNGEAQVSFTHATPEQLLASAVIAN